MTVDPRVAERLANIVLARIENNEMQLPVLPEAATSCLGLLKNPNTSAKQLGGVLERDPLLTAQLLRVANSAGFTSGVCKTLDQAIARVGLSRIKSMVVAASAMQLFESRDPQIREASKKLWHHSIAVGIIARDLIALSGHGDPEEGYLGGLLHDIGKPVMAAFLLEAEKQISPKRGQRWMESEAWLETVRIGHRRVAVALAEEWNMPAQIVSAIRHCDDFDPAERCSIANYVRFANAVAKLEGIYVGPVDEDDTKALVMIGRSLLGVDADLVERVSKGLQERIQRM